MSCYCCDKILDLCSVDVCNGLLKTGLKAPASGWFTISVEFLGFEYLIKKQFNQDDDLNFNVQGLNENYVFVGKILNAAGTQLSFTVNDVEYNCISFKTKLSYLISEEPLMPS